MTQPAKLGAHDLPLRKSRGCEMERYHQAWNEVLLNPQLRHIEGVPHVLRVQLENYGRVDGARQRRRSDIATGRGIVGGVEPHEVSRRRVDHLGVELSEFSVGPRVPEIVGE